MLLNKTTHICDIAVEDGTRIQAHSDGMTSIWQIKKRNIVAVNCLLLVSMDRYIYACAACYRTQHNSFVGWNWQMPF